MPNPICGLFQLFHSAREGSPDNRKFHSKTPFVKLTFNESAPACVLLSASPSAAATLALPAPGTLMNPAHARQESAQAPA